jgi:metal-dependent amidase/aminoacylase/carboxypeptidase family protein
VLKIRLSGTKDLRLWLMTRRLVNFAEKIARKEGWQISPVQLSMAGDDFSYYKSRGNPQAVSLYMKIGMGTKYPIHHPSFTANLALLEPTAKLLAALGTAVHTYPFKK